MYKKLHRRLTLLFTCVSGAILIAMSISYLYMSEREMKENHFLTFSSRVNSLISSLEQQDTLTWEWLVKTSANQDLILALYDNGLPIAYTRKVLSAQDLALTNEAKAYAKNAYPHLESGSFYSAAHQEFSFLSAENDSYHASILNMRKNQSILTGIVLFPVRSFLLRMQKQRLLFLLLNMAGIFLLLIFSWYFTGKLLTPIVEAREKQTNFVAAASHELRTPIAVIVSAISAAKTADSAKKAHFFRIIEDESIRLSTLADDLLLLNRSDTGRFHLNIAPTELDTLLLNVCESFEPLAKEHEISIKTELPDDAAPLCNCDRERIQQVLGILISNAISYGRPGGHIRLSLSYAKSLFRIMVEDDGVGIADQDKPFIFDRFYRSDKSRSAKNHFGLGLSIAKEITEEHGGKIMVADTPGGGARFFVLL